MVFTTSEGCFPLAVSPLNMTAPAAQRAGVCKPVRGGIGNEAAVLSAVNCVVGCLSTQYHSTCGTAAPPSRLSMLCSAHLQAKFTASFCKDHAGRFVRIWRLAYSRPSKKNTVVTRVVAYLCRQTQHWQHLSSQHVMARGSQSCSPSSELHRSPASRPPANKTSNQPSQARYMTAADSQDMAQQLVVFQLHGWDFVVDLMCSRMLI